MASFRIWRKVLLLLDGRQRAFASWAGRSVNPYSEQSAQSILELVVLAFQIGCLSLVASLNYAIHLNVR